MLCPAHLLIFLKHVQIRDFIYILNKQHDYLRAGLWFINALLEKRGLKNKKKGK